MVEVVACVPVVLVVPVMVPLTVPGVEESIATWIDESTAVEVEGVAVASCGDVIVTRQSFRMFGLMSWAVQRSNCALNPGASDRVQPNLSLT